MTFLDVVFVALIQGVAEVLPLSAAGHLGLLSGLGANPEGRAAIAAAADLGIALALMVYFWRDMAAIGRALLKLAKGRVEPGAVLLFKILAGTIPALGLSWLLADAGRIGMGHGAIAACLIGFGAVLWLADHLGVTVRRVEHLGGVGAVVLGLLQVVAIFPGVSRTAITVIAARLMGFERTEAARFSLLLAIPMLAGQAALEALHLSGHAPLMQSSGLFLAGGLGFIAALISVAGMMAWLVRHTYAPFAGWRILVGALALAAIVF